MAISPQLPQLIAALRPGALQALALQAGQVLNAQIIGPAPNGGTQVQIAGQLLNLLLPLAVEAGTTIRLEVQATGPQVKLALLPQAASPQPAQVAQPQSMPSRPPLMPLEQSVSPLSTAPVALVGEASPAPSSVNHSGQGSTLSNAPSSRAVAGMPTALPAAKSRVQSQPPVAVDQPLPVGTRPPLIATSAV
ncbi:MAG TPA: hypothetical protein VGB81_12835, partial [Devosia sp.]